MRRYLVLLALVFVSLATLPRIMPARAEDEAPADVSVATDMAISSEIDPTTRYQILSMPNGKDMTALRFDRDCGQLERLSTEGRTPGWQAISIPGLMPCLLDSRSHYQLYSTGNGHAYLLNTDNKVTWDIDLAHLTAVQM
jgi:hypothetical protein